MLIDQICERKNHGSSYCIFSFAQSNISTVGLVTCLLAFSSINTFPYFPSDHEELETYKINSLPSLLPLISVNGRRGWEEFGRRKGEPFSFWFE